MSTDEQLRRAKARWQAEALDAEADAIDAARPPIPPGSEAHRREAIAVRCALGHVVRRIRATAEALRDAP